MSTNSQNNLWKCPNFNLVAWRYDKPGHAIMTRLRCKQWSCEYCAKLNREAWRSHLKKRIGTIGGVWWFVTLTAHENLRDAKSSLKNIRDNIDRLMKRLRRIYGQIDYVRVYEVHKTGAYHAHMVIHGLSGRLTRVVKANGNVIFRNNYTEGVHGSWSIRTWFKKTARGMGMGYMVDVQPVEDVRKVTNYICKYMTKALQSYECRYLRRIQTSRRIGTPNERSNTKWTIAGHVWAGEMHETILYDANLKFEIQPSFWRENIVYPAEN